MLKHKPSIPDIERMLIEEEVPAITFRSLLDKYGVKRVDLVYIDTEGFDDEVVKMVCSSGILPEIIVFEYKHLDQRAVKSTFSLLRSKGYCVERQDRTDAVAIRNELLSLLRDRPW